MNISHLLQRVLMYERRPDAPTVADLAHATDVHERTCYYYIEGDRVPSVDWLVAASRYLLRSCGDARIAEAMLADGYAIVPTEGRTNGRIDDEIRAIIQLLGEASTSESQGALHEARERTDELLRAVMQMREEIKRRMQS